MSTINMTPHDIHLVNDSGNILKTFPISGKQIRLKVFTVQAEPLPDGTPTSKTEFGEPEGLPEFQEGIFYLVSQLVKNALPNRTDLLVPAEVLRNDKGEILGCRSLGR